MTRRAARRGACSPLAVAACSRRWCLAERRARSTSRSTPRRRSSRRSSRSKTAYEAANPGTTLTVSTDSSAALETKIEQGAPADVFLSADTTNPQKLVDGGFASGDVTPFAGNALTIIVPGDNPAGIRTPADLAKPGVKIVAAGRCGADHAVRDPARRQPRQGARVPADFAAALRGQRRVAGGQRRRHRHEGRARRGRRRDRVRHRCHGLRQGRDDRGPGRRERAGDLWRRRRQGVARPGSRRRRSSPGSPGARARPSSRSSASCRPAHDRSRGRERPATRTAGQRASGGRCRASRSWPRSPWACPSSSSSGAPCSTARCSSRRRCRSSSTRSR